MYSQGVIAIFHMAHCPGYAVWCSVSLPYGPHLMPYDFHVFGLPKEVLEDHRFGLDVDVRDTQV